MINRRKRYVNASLFFLFISASIMCQSELKKLLPESIEDYRTDKDTVYNPENLYDYIDGGAELYISYGFKEVLSRKYICERHSDIVVEIFDMKTPANAFGVFTQQRDTEDAGVGQGSQYVPGNLIFWKNKYFISLMSLEETDKSKRVLFTIGSTIDSLIPEEGNKPEMLNVLPDIGIDYTSIKYFTHPTWVNSLYFITHDNLFFISDDNQALLARYTSEGETAFFLLVQYKERKNVAKAHKSATTGLSLPEDGSIIKNMENRWEGMSMHDNMLIYVFHASNENIAHHLMHQIIK